jgi:hypothetical protein
MPFTEFDIYLAGALFVALVGIGAYAGWMEKK